MSNHKAMGGPSFIAYQVTDLGDKKSAWTRIGAGFTHKDSMGIDIRLDAFPRDGRIVLRVPSPRKPAEK